MAPVIVVLELRIFTSEGNEDALDRMSVGSGYASKPRKYEWIWVRTQKSAAAFLR